VSAITDVSHAESSGTSTVVVQTFAVQAATSRVP
jgi:hypothetical protein